MFSDIIKGYISAIKYMSNYSSLKDRELHNLRHSLNEGITINSGSVINDISGKYMYLFTKLYIESI